MNKNYDELIEAIHTTIHQIQEDMKNITTRLIWIEENMEVNKK